VARALGQSLVGSRRLVGARVELLRHPCGLIAMGATA